MTPCRYCPVMTPNDLCAFHRISWLRLQAKQCLDCGVPTTLMWYCSRCRASRTWHNMPHDRGIVEDFGRWRKTEWQRMKRATT